MSELPTAARSLMRKLADGWTHTATHARGPATFTTLSEQTDGEGKRKRIELVEDVDSVLLRLRHCATRRAVVALWVRRDGKGWTLDFALRGRHAAEHTPQRLDAAQLTAYVTATSPAEYAQAIGQLAAKRAATTAKAAATRAAKKTATQDISTSVDTEDAA